MSHQHQISIHGSSAVPVRNEKGDMTMKKVKVHRYISGKRPEYAQNYSSDEESDTDNFVDRRAQRNFANRGEDRQPNDSYENETETTDDPRLRRLMQVHRKDSESDEVSDDDRESRLRRHRRRVHEPEIIQEEDAQIESDVEMVDPEPVELERKRRIELGSDSSESELSDTQVENRRQRLRQKVLQQQRKEEEILVKEEEKQSESSDSEETESEETESEEEENEPRLKPLFVSKRDRATIAEKEKEIQRQKQMEHEAKRMAKERRRQTLRMVEESVKKDLDKAKVRCFVFLLTFISQQN